MGVSYFLLSSVTSSPAVGGGGVAVDAMVWKWWLVGGRFRSCVVNKRKNSIEFLPFTLALPTPFHLEPSWLSAGRAHQRSLQMHVQRKESGEENALPLAGGIRRQ